MLNFQLYLVLSCNRFNEGKVQNLVTFRSDNNVIGSFIWTWVCNAYSHFSSVFDKNLLAELQVAQHFVGVHAWRPPRENSRLTAWIKAGFPLTEFVRANEQKANVIGW